MKKQIFLIVALSLLGFTVFAKELKDISTITSSGDLQINIRNNKAEIIGGNAQSEAGRDTRIRSGNDVSVQAGRTVTIVGGNLLSEAGRDTRIRSGNDVSVQAGRTVTITAADSLILKVGAASIVMHRNGDITIAGKSINIKGSGDVVIKGRKILQN